MKRFWAVPLATVLACCVGLGVVSAAEVEPTPQFDPPAQQQTPPSGTQPYYPVTPAPAAPAKPAPKQPAKEPQLKKLPQNYWIYYNDPDVRQSVVTPENMARARAKAYEYSYNLVCSPLILVRLPLQLALDPQVLEKDPELREQVFSAGAVLLIYVSMTPVAGIPFLYGIQSFSYYNYELENMARRQEGYEELDVFIATSPEETLEGMSSDWQQLQKKYSQTADLSDIRSAFETSDVLESVQENLEDFGISTGLDALLRGNSLLSVVGSTNK